MLDSDLRIEYANHAGQALLELSLNQLKGLALERVVSHCSIAFERMRQAFLEDEGISDSEVQVAFPDGRYMLADITLSCVVHEDQKVLLLEIRKIDQQKRISQESQQWAQQQAARDLIRGLAHEIKNPLGGIRGAAQLLEKELHNAELTEFTQMIIEQSDRLRNLVDRLLGPNALPKRTWQNIHRVLEKVRTLVTLDDSHDISIERDYDPSIPDLWVDEDMIQQAVLNVMRNSIQALMSVTYEGQIRLVTRVERQMTIHGRRYPLVAQIKVIDNGPGIPQDIRDTLFYPMVTGKKDGTGLGLSIAQTLVDHHRGKIDVESWPGHTEFTIYIPVDKKEPVI